MDSQDEQFLHDIYLDTKHRTAFSSAEKLWKYIKLQGRNITRKQLNQWLMKQDVYTSHHPIVRKFPTVKVVTYGINKLWDADLMDVRNLADTNDGINYIAIFIDVFSRYLYAEPMEGKTAEDSVKAIKSVFSRSKQQPDKFRSDAGQEFLGKAVKEYLAEREIYQQVSRTEKKANYAERVILTLKKKIYRYMWYHDTDRYIDVLQDLVAGYNDNYHSSIKCAPSAVTKANETAIWAEQYLPEPSEKVQKIKYKFKVGDVVRISNNRHPFSRGYGQTFSEELFKIQIRHGSNPPTYTLVDLQDKKIDGLFYDQEMVLVGGYHPDSKDRVYRIEAVLKERIRKGKKEVLIKWKGYSNSFNTWEPASNLI